MSGIRAMKAAVGGIHAPIAVFAASTSLVALLLAAAVLLSGCVAPGREAAGRGAAASASPESTGPTPVAPQEPTEPAPAIPRVSAALEDRVPLRGAPPVRLVVPSLDIDVPIEPVGLDDQGRMGLPADPSVAAWYSYGSAPGDATGSAVVAAHVDSLEYDIGPFSRLADAPSGTVVQVTSADGAVRGFSLASIEIVPKGTVDWPSVFRRDGSPALTLVTCGGDFDREARRYLSSVIVTALPIG